MRNPIRTSSVSPPQRSDDDVPPPPPPEVSCVVCRPAGPRVWNLRPEAEGSSDDDMPELVSSSSTTDSDDDAPPPREQTRLHHASPPREQTHSHNVPPHTRPRACTLAPFCIVMPSCAVHARCHQRHQIPLPESIVLHGRARHSESQGSIERLNRDVNKMLGL